MTIKNKKFDKFVKKVAENISEAIKIDIKKILEIPIDKKYMDYSTNMLEIELQRINELHKIFEPAYKKIVKEFIKMQFPEVEEIPEEFLWEDFKEFQSLRIK